MRIEKEKNILKIYLYSEKPYSIDINTGVFYGTRGSPIKTVPVGLSEALEDAYDNSVLTKMLYKFYHDVNMSEVFTHFVECQKYLALADKLDAIGIGARMIHPHTIINQYDVICENFKDFSKALKDDPTLSVERYLSEVGFNKWLEKCKMVLPHNTPTTLPHFLKTYFYENGTEQKQMAEKYGHWIIYYLVNRGLYKAFINDINNYDDLVYLMLYEFFSVCDKLEKEPQKQDFLKIYTEYRETYKIKKDEIDSKVLKEWYDTKREKLFFEDDEYIVVIPSAPSDFEREAEQQSNCVYRAYLPEVIKKRTFVVFIRRKADPTKSYITCEVNPKGGINQFYYRNNGYAKDNEFYEKYANHLKRNW